MLHNLRTIIPVLTLGLLLSPDAQAARLVVFALSSPHGQAPVEQADALTSYLIARRHRTIAGPDAQDRLLVGNVGAGADWAANVQGILRRGRESLTRLDRHAAEQSREQAYQAIVRAGGGAGGAEPLVQWALLESALAASSGNLDLAKQWLDRAATLGPHVILDPLVHPEPERHAFLSACQAVHERSPGTLETISVPPSAEVWIDGTMRCRTPCTPSLPPGIHFVRITSPAHTPATFSLAIPSGGTVSRHVGLTSAYTGASLHAIEAMLDNPSRTPEAQSALAAIARFLDVDHVIVVRRASRGSFSLRIAPVPSDSDAYRGGLSEETLPSSIDTMLHSALRTREEGSKNWYESPSLWVGVASVAVIAIGTGLFLSRGSDTSAASHGTLVIGGP